VERALILGSSDGIGLALAQKLASAGTRVVGFSKSPSRFVHDRYHHLVGDVTSPDFPEVLRRLWRSSGPHDLCVYCAGIGDPVDFQRLPAETHVFRVNLMGALATAEVVLPEMLGRGAGHFVVLSSLADTMPSALVPSYNASKAALTFHFEGLSRALRNYRSPVAITNVRFGFVNTKMAKAPSKPFMITADQAADVVIRALRERPIRVTHPWQMAVALWFRGIFVKTA